jgi:hypothetical protein
VCNLPARTQAAASVVEFLDRGVSQVASHHSFECRAGGALDIDLTPAWIRR